MNFSSERLRNSQAPSSSSNISSQYIKRFEESRHRISSSGDGCPAVRANTRSTCTSLGPALSTGLETGIESLKVNAGSKGSKMAPASTCTANTAATEKDEGSAAASTAATTSSTLSTSSNRSTRNYSQPRTSKCVRFCDAIAIREFHTLGHQYKYFYDDEDLELFGRDMKNTIKKVRKGGMDELDPDQHTLQGLEHFFSKQIFKEVYTEKQLTTRHVLNAQSLGLAANEIAEICSRTTRGALARARNRGAEYQADAFLFYKSMT